MAEDNPDNTSDLKRIKAQLIKFGFWGADELGDPTTNIHDAGTLQDRLQAMLAEEAFLVSEIPPDLSWNREISIFHKRRTDKLATAPSYIEAICLAALALPEFLKQHPECAAADCKPDSKSSKKGAAK
jgi:hypothetical protein